MCLLSPRGKGELEPPDQAWCWEESALQSGLAPGKAQAVDLVPLLGLEGSAVPLLWTTQRGAQCTSSTVVPAPSRSHCQPAELLQEGQVTHHHLCWLCSVTVP